MIRKELLMHFIAYNAIRHLIYEVSCTYEKDPMRISYKGALQVLRLLEFYFHEAAYSPQRIRQLREHLHDTIAKNIIPFRSGRSEPRCLKRSAIRVSPIISSFPIRAPVQCSYRK